MAYTCYCYMPQIWISKLKICFYQLLEYLETQPWSKKIISWHFVPKIAFCQNFSQDLLCNFELEIWPKCSVLGTPRNQSIGWDIRRRFKYYGSYKTSIQGFLMAPWNYRSIKKCWCPHPYWNSEFNPSKKDVPTTKCRFHPTRSKVAFRYRGGDRLFRYD